MTVSVDGTIPPELMNPDALNQVVAFLRLLKVLPSVKRQLLARWALIVGVQVDPSLYRYVQGVDRS